MSKYNLGKRADVPISLVKRGEKTNTRGSGWWQSCKKCPICKSEGKRVYMFTNGKSFVCNTCKEKEESKPVQIIGPKQHMRIRELEK